MKKSVITFWKGSGEAQKATNKFLKKHWKGYIVFEAVVFATGYVIPSIIGKVKDLIETKKEKSEEEES